MTAETNTTRVDHTRLADCLKLLSGGPKELPDDHKAIAYLMHHKHRLAIISTLVTPGTQRPDRYSKLPQDAKPAIRRWELLPDYTKDQVEAVRCRGRAEAAYISATVERKDWQACLGQIEHPLMRDTVADVLRGWW